MNDTLASGWLLEAVRNDKQRKAIFARMRGAARTVPAKSKGTPVGSKKVGSPVVRGAMPPKRKAKLKKKLVKPAKRVPADKKTTVKTAKSVASKKPVSNLPPVSSGLKAALSKYLAIIRSKLAGGVSSLKKKLIRPRKKLFSSGRSFSMALA